MAARLEEAFTGQKRFLGDTAHELCSPLARMEMALGVLEQRADGCEDALLADVHEEVRAMSALVDDLLVFSKASAGTRAATLQPVLLAQLAAGVISREAGATGSVTSDIPESLAVTADPALLARALANVIRNAVRYAGDAGPIRLSAVERSHEALLSITDCGPGVPGEMLHRLFDPFFRPESARTRETGGTGLGLAIVKSCIEACHGSVAVKNLKPRGFCVEIRLTKEPSSDS